MIHSYVLIKRLLVRWFIFVDVNCLFLCRNAFFTCPVQFLFSFLIFHHYVSSVDWYLARFVRCVPLLLFLPYFNLNVKNVLSVSAIRRYFSDVAKKIYRFQNSVSLILEYVRLLLLWVSTSWCWIISHTIQRVNVLNKEGEAVGMLVLLCSVN